ncbi:MAG TPA: hypothetical protein VF613_09115 [Longimicrobium sp.]|jgi:hypothetical protein
MRIQPIGERAEEALREVERVWHSWWGRHWPDFAVAAAALALLVRFAFVAVGAWRAEPAKEPPALPDGRLALPLVVAPGATPDSLRAGMLATLVVSPAEPTGSALIMDSVPVLAARGERVVLAVTRAQLESLAPQLGSARIIVLTR